MVLGGGRARGRWGERELRGRFLRRRIGGRGGGTEEREEGGAVTLINDQHVDVPQRQQRTNTNTNVPPQIPVLGAMMQWTLVQLFFRMW